MFSTFLPYCVILISAVFLDLSNGDESGLKFNPFFDSESEWTPFCDEETYYKPYIRVRQGRNGDLIKEMGPGLLETMDMENIYICANGLIFLYFKNEYKAKGEVYDDAVMQHASHYCGFYNGKPGPGIDEREETLNAILLVAHPQDYRKVALQMFNAPIYSPFAQKTINFTSLAIVNAEGECIIERGAERARIRVKGNPTEEAENAVYQPDEERLTTVCRLDGHLILQEDNSQVPLNFDWSTSEDTLRVLTLEEDKPSDLKLIGCYKYPLINWKHIGFVRERAEESTEDGFDIGTEVSELNPGPTDGPTFWTPERLEKYGNPTVVIPEDDETLAAAVQATFDALNGAEKDETGDDAETAYHFAVLKKKLAPYLIHYQKLFGAARSAAQDATEAWERVLIFMADDTLEEMITNFEDVQKEMVQLNQDLLEDPYNLEILDRIEELKFELADADEELRQKTLELGPEISKAEIKTGHRDTYVDEAYDVMDKIMDLIYTFETNVKELESKPDFKEADHEPFLDTIVSIKNPPNISPSDDGPPCFDFDRKQEQCQSVKPKEKRACQIAKIKLTGTTPWPGDEGWRDEVLDLMSKIFSKGCNRLQPNFGKAITSIVKGYLTKQIEDDEEYTLHGVPFIMHIREQFIKNYNISENQGLNPPIAPKEAARWDEILERLQKCEELVKPFEFEVDSSSGAPLRILFGGKPLPRVVEQADLEFSFNWAVDTSFRIFGFVAGTCAPDLDDDLLKSFYEGYTKSFLDPIRTIWLSNRDNPIFRVTNGQSYITGKADLWTRQCMEASFHHSGVPHLRPIRNLLVNSYMEPNFIALGPGQGTRGPFYEASPGSPGATGDETSPESQSEISRRSSPTNRRFKTRI